MRVAVVDQHDVVRAGVERWLAEHRPHLMLAGSFRRPEDYLAWLPAAGAVDVLVTEIAEGGRAPDIDRVRALSAAGPAVIVHSGFVSDEVILASLEAGATSFVAKCDGRDHLINALRSAGTDRPYEGPRMAAALDRSRSVGRLGLSERERQVLVAWLRTESKDDVGSRLDIAPATVRTHLQRVRTKYARLGRSASDKSALLARAIEDGIIGTSDLNGH